MARPRGTKETPTEQIRVPEPLIGPIKEIIRVFRKLERERKTDEQDENLDDKEMKD